ncbi:uncharacterized protein LOC108738326 [Agrilus planipennis]|uniref:Uncharacterized protein LOC108738326 n=1 Tax=Agrilus planipennis TaxID=224129 RepID=A0A1W4X4E8_AGRPL|nr:uncharacterized protein LOC108738326 [Agrilus planipennis]
MAEKETLIKHIRKLLHKLSLTEKLINITPSALSGDGYLGMITKVYLVAVNNNGSTKTLNLIVKSATANPGVRSQLRIDVAFKTESIFYEKIFTVFDRLQTENGITEPFISVPCYYTCTDYLDETLILEDMKEQNYLMYKKSTSLDYDHIILSLKTYAKFHALSFALRDQKSDIFEQLRQEVKTTFTNSHPKELLQKFMESSNADLLASLSQDERIQNKMKEIVKRSVETLLDEGTQENEYCVFIHGDCWLNNLLFKYGNSLKPNTPTEMRLLDFQFSTVASPASEVSSFFFINIANELLVDKHDQFLELYHKTLSDFLVKLGSDPNKLFPWDGLKQQMKKYSIRGLLSSLQAIRLLRVESDKLPNLNNCTDFDDVVKQFDTSFEKNEDYYKALRDISLLCDKLGYI